MDRQSPLVARIFGAIDLVAALVVVIGVFVALPTRWWVVDVPSAAVGLLLGIAGAGLVTGAPWAERVARIASLVVLVAGLALVATLAVTASYLSGIYGAVGKGGSVILVLVAALALPYLIALPAAQLLWLGPGRREGATG
ncbi:MAG TPA: hypothetical protein VGI39_08020 [Polyangiaceae bacterium]|jgi:hypothetical protein